VTDFDRFLAPIEGETPCGPDLEYDNEFLALTQAVTGKAEQQFGDTVIPAGDPDWREADVLAQALLLRTKDLRVVAWLTLANTYLRGVGEFAKGLKLALGLCEQYWDEVHPRIVVDGDDDPYLRMNAIAAFSVPEYSGENRLIQALRSCVLIKAPLALTFRDLELSFNKAQEATYSLAQIEPMVAAALAANSGELLAVMDSYVTYQALRTLVDDRVSSADAPDMDRLTGVLKPVVRALERLRTSANGEAADVSAGVDDATVGGAVSTGGVAIAGGTGAIQSREDVRRALDRICEYLERAEPSNPATLFARRAQRMLNMQFLDLIRELSPDSLQYLETLTGAQARQQDS
jgi:type VI secretion system protein ImpA